MRAFAISLALALTLSMGAWAQRGGGGRGGGGGFRGSSIGGGGFRGGTVAHGGFVGGGFRGGFAGNGFRGGFGFRGGYGYGAFSSPYSYWGLGWGSPYYGSGWDYGYYPYPSYVWNNDYGYSYRTVATVGSYGGGYAPSAPVVVNQSYMQPPAVPVMREYPQDSGSGSPAETSSQPSGSAQGSTIYLIALNDGVIRAALAYWVQGTTLHYLGTDHVQKNVPMDLVDRGLSAQLNRERRVPFRLP